MRLAQAQFGKWRRWLVRIGILPALLLITACSVGLSIGICYAIHCLSGNGESFLFFFKYVVLAPLLIAPPISYVLLKMLAELNRTRQELRIMATTDVLTGVANRRHMLECAASLSAHQPVSMLMIDLDHFKGINDTFGHAIGDEALIAVAGACMSRLAEGELFGRWGGEEFLAVLRGNDIARANRIAEELRLAVESIRLARCPRPLTVSIGIAIGASNPALQPLDTLLWLADRNLYAAKQQGRNRSVAIAA